jgi:hypothetical protein
LSTRSTERRQQDRTSGWAEAAESEAASTAEGGGFGGGGLFGGMGNATDRRYNLTFSVSARNVLNVVNLATPNGVLGSPFFGQANALSTGPFSSAGANRSIDLQLAFAF